VARKDYPQRGPGQRHAGQRAPDWTPLGKTSSQVGSPGQQSYDPSCNVPVTIKHGFLANLPGRSRIFFQRQFFTSYPRPIQNGAATPFPRVVPIATIEAPKQQAIVIRSVVFRAYQHSGIGIEDLQAVPEGRGIGTLGFRFNVGNRGISDFMTNLPGRGIPVVFGQQGATAVAPQSGQGTTYQGIGMITPPPSGDAFAKYAMPGDIIQSQAVIFRPPSFDLRVFRVDISGWLASEFEIQKIIDHLSR
jgi:hypothetical protein